MRKKLIESDSTKAFYKELPSLITVLHNKFNKLDRRIKNRRKSDRRTIKDENR